MKDSEVDTAAVPVDCCIRFDPDSIAVSDPSVEYAAGNDMVAGGAAPSGGYR